MSWLSSLQRGVSRAASSAWDFAEDVAGEAIDIGVHAATGNWGGVLEDVIDVGGISLDYLTDIGGTQIDYITGNGADPVPTNGAAAMAGAAVSTATNGAGAIGTGASGVVRAAGTYPANGHYYKVHKDPLTGQWVWKPWKQRRRRRLLTASDKADVAFLIGQLGQGQMGRAAISALLSRRSG